ncbi:hypothetical protein ACPJHQ_05685 [Rossellomorea sp. H39__3]
MEGWSKFENEIVEMNVFHHQADMRIFIWLLTHVTFKAGLRVGEVELSSRQYVTSLKQLQKDLWFYDGRKKRCIPCPGSIDPSSAWRRWVF